MDIIPPEIQATSNATQWVNLFEGFLQDATKIGQALEAGAKVVILEMEKAECESRRAQLLEAYRFRRRWKKSDVTPLASLNVNEIAQKRIARLSGTGRPVVKTYKPLWERPALKAIAFQVLFNKDKTSEERRKAFWECPWHEYYVEALYRGEHARAKSQKQREAAHSAEAEIASALRISSSKVRQICGKIRRIAEEDNGFPPATIAEFDTWMRTGLSALNQ